MDNQHPADMLFDLREKKKKIDASIEVYRNLLLELPQSERDGSFTRVKVTEQNRKSIDTKAIKYEMGENWLDDRSSIKTITIVKIEANDAD